MGDSLLFPLRAGNAALILLLAGLASLLYVFLILLRDAGGGGVFGVSAFVLLFLLALAAFNSLFDFCLDVIEDSARGGSAERPLGWKPLADLVIGERRLLRHALLLLLLLEAVRRLHDAGQAPAAYALLALALLLLPASLAVHALQGGAGAMLNPLRLLALVRLLGPAYLLSLPPLFLAPLLLAGSLQGPVAGMFLRVAAALYGLLAMARLLGLLLARHRDVLLPLRDGWEERQEMREAGERNAQFDALLLAAYERLRAGDAERALGLLLPAVEFGQWARFEQAFPLVAAWPDSRPALALIQGYLPVLLERRQYMRALALCGQALAMDPAFAPRAGESLGLLLPQAASPEQYGFLVAMLCNRARQADAQEAARCRAIAADLRASLKDEALYPRLAEEE